MHSHRDILLFIAEIRQSHQQMVHIFTHGSCLNFYHILKHVYKSAEAYMDIDHVVTKIGTQYYDINGTVHPKQPIRFSDYLSEKPTRKMYRQMYNDQAKLV